MAHKTLIVPNQTKSSNSGFTLVELLVVISIIALLLSIMMPALNKARSQAKDIMCVSNVKSLFTGIYAYSAANNDMTPDKFNEQARDRGEKVYNWKGYLHQMKYLPDAKNFVCPSKIQSKYTQKFVDNAPAVGFYGINALWEGGPFGDDGKMKWRNVKFSQVRNPSSKFLVGDNNGDWPFYYIIFSVKEMVGLESYWSYKTDIIRHKGSANIGFVDGHAGKVLGKDIHPADNFWKNFLRDSSFKR